MLELKDEVLRDLVKAMDQAIQSCEQAQTAHSVTKLKSTIAITHYLMAAARDVVEDNFAIVANQEDLAFLAQIAKLLITQSDVERGTAELMRRINAHFSTEAISIFTFNSDRNELLLKYADGPVGDDIVGLRMSANQGVVGWVVRNDETLIVPSTDLEVRFFGGVDKQTGFITRSILCVPFHQEGDVKGALEIINKTTGYFYDGDVILLQAVAQMISNYIS